MSRKPVFPDEICPDKRACTPKPRLALDGMPIKENNDVVSRGKLTAWALKNTRVLR